MRKQGHYVSDVVTILDAEKGRIGSLDFDRYTPLPETFVGCRWRKAGRRSVINGNRKRE